MRYGFLSATLPLLRRYPDAIGQLAISLAQDHQRHAEAAAQEPDSTLLTEVAQILRLDGEDSGEGAQPS